MTELAANARERVKRGYYGQGRKATGPTRSLVESIKHTTETPIIAEVKYASPSAGKIRDLGQAEEIAKAMMDGGACGISVLTDPENFEGSLETLANISKLGIPTIMKDIIVSPVQLLAGKQAGASAVVLISEVFSKKLASVGIETIMLEASRLGLETLVEANSAFEFENLHRFRPDLYGINNRNLSTFELDLSTTEKILVSNPGVDRPLVSESGIESANDVRRLKAAGADAFLVGTSIMKAADIERKVSELVNA